MYFLFFNNEYCFWDNVTNCINGNGPYVLSGLPQYNQSNPPDPPCCTGTNYMDADGATLIIIYQNKCSPYTGCLTIDGGLIWEDNPTSISLTSSCGSGSGAVPGNAFFIADDLEYCIETANIDALTNLPITSPIDDIWNTVQTGTMIMPNSGVNTYSINGSSNDCYDWLALGAYYQIPSTQCGPLVSITYPVCTGASTGSATAIATGGSAPYTYLWSNAATTSGITGISSGNYTVTVTDASGCTVTASASVNFDFFSVSISGSDIACASTTGLESYTATVTGGVGPFTYSWSTQSTSNLSVYGSPNVNPVQILMNTAIGGDIFVTVTDANGCTATASFLVMGCCVNSGAGITLTNQLMSLFNNNNNIPGVLFSGNTWTFQCFLPGNSVVINGILDINGPSVTFRNCDVLLAPNAKIIVETGQTLTINCSHLHACSNMWNQIDVKTGATLIVNYSLIEDAFIAAYIENGAVASTFTFINSIFNQNWIGAEVLPSTANSNPWTVTNCRFSCDQSYSNISCTGLCGIFTLSNNVVPLPLIAPMNNVRGAYGMYIYGISNPSFPITIGLNNTFEDIDCGIYTAWSQTQLYADTFCHMNQLTLWNNVGVPLAGVYARGNVFNSGGPYTLWVGSTTAPCFFYNCNYGIWARDTINTTILFSTMYGFENNPGIFKANGIYLQNNDKCVIQVNANSIYNDFIGINCYMNFLSKLDIEGNIIGSNINSWAPNNSTVGILVNELLPTSPRYNIHGNSIDTVANGVICNNITKGIINYNNILLTGLGVPIINNEGILLQDCDHSLISNNTINSMNLILTNPPKLSDGIRISVGFAFNHVLCNTINNIGTDVLNGFYAELNQIPIVIDINNFTMGIGHLRNPSTGVKVIIPNTYIGNQGSATQVTVNCWDPFNFNPGPPWATYTWRFVAGTFYVSLGNGNGNYCEYPNWPFEHFPINNPIKFIPENTTNDPNYCPSFYALAGPTPPPLETADAWTMIRDANIGNFYPQTTQWTENYNLYFYLATFDTSLCDSSPIIRRFYDSSKNTNLGKIVAIQTLLSDTNGISPTDLSLAQALNNSITSPDTAESTYKALYSIVIPRYQNSYPMPTPAGVDSLALSAIAWLCPYEYGEAVYIARSLMEQRDTINYYNACEEQNCNEQDDLMIKKPENDTRQYNVNVYPNPANTILNVAINPDGIDSALINNSNFILYNSAGQMMITEKLTQPVTQIPVSALSDGVYFYSIISFDKIAVKSDVVVIQK